MRAHPREINFPVLVKISPKLTKKYYILIIIIIFFYCKRYIKDDNQRFNYVLIIDTDSFIYVPILSYLIVR